MFQASDIEILEFARSQNRVCVTLDRDFHAHLALAAASQPSVILLRWQGLKSSDLADLLLKIWPKVEPYLLAGAAVTVSERSIRVRVLPLSRSE